MKEYVVSDGTQETADKIRAYFIALGVDPSEVYAMAFVSKISNCYWAESMKKIGNEREAPEGYTLKVL